MSPNPEAKLSLNTELAFTEAHLTYLNRKIVQQQNAVQLRVLGYGGGQLPPLPPPLWLRHWPQTPLGELTALPRPLAGGEG